MVDRLRALLQDPHDPTVARAVVVLASAVTLGLTVVVGLGGSGGSPVASGPTRTPVAGASTAPARQVVSQGKSSLARHRSRPRQDPQDRPGSPAAHRARHELASHRAFQHLPFRHGGVTITLIGAEGTRAVLRIEAASLPDARRGWRGFLRRYHDDGHAYQPRFEAGRRR